MTRSPVTRPKSYAKSKALFDRAKNVLAGGVASEFRKFSHPHPLFYERASGSRIWDVDGNEYLDFTLSQGPMILGHSHPRVLEAIEKASAEGQLFAGQHLQELELAETLQRLIPCAESLRFSLSGSEADHAALRLARAATGRPKFIRFLGHYHGWLDNAAFGVSGSGAWSQGLPDRVFEEAILLSWNDLDAVRETLRTHGAEVAAIITEPVMCNTGCIPPKPGFLQGLRDLCDEFGVPLIFDEVITGFRLGLSGARGFFGVTPDLAVFGKAMASGYPISVLVGKAKYMSLIAEGKVIHAGTMNSGNPTVAAALTTIRVLEEEKIHDRLFAYGKRLMSGLAAIAGDLGLPLLIQGFGPMFHAGFTPLRSVSDLAESQFYDESLYAQFVGGMQERGVRLIGRGLWYISGTHTERDIDCALEAARDALTELAENADPKLLR